MKQDTDLTTTAIASAASLSNRPFRTAFMATMGIAAAQFILFLAGVGTLGFVGLALWFLLVR